MSIFICKTINFIFNTWTISRPHTFNITIEHRTSIKSFFQRIVNHLICIRNPAASLFFWFFNIHKRKSFHYGISSLNFHFCIIKTSSIHSRRRSSFHSSTLKSQRQQLFRNSCSFSFCSSSSTKFFITYMYQTIEKSTIG